MEKNKENAVVTENEQGATKGEEMMKSIYERPMKQTDDPDYEEPDWEKEGFNHIVRSTKYPLSELAEEINKVLTGPECWVFEGCECKLNPIVFEINKTSGHIKDILLKKGERYLSFGGDNASRNIYDVAEFLPKKIADSLIIYNHDEMLKENEGTRRFNSKFSIRNCETVENLIKKLKTLEAKEIKRDGRKNSIMDKLSKNKRAIEKNIQEKKEPIFNRDKTR